MKRNCVKRSISRSSNSSLIKGTGWFLLFTLIVSCSSVKREPRRKSRPNILFIISDDQGYPSASAYGCPFVHTPTFDEIARKGILFNQAFVCAPQCSPSRASILTGQFIWQNGPAGTHWSTFPAALKTYTDLLSRYGYQVGYTGKGWAPGNWIDGGRTDNPAGPYYEDTAGATSFRKTRYASGISSDDYAGSFKLFLSKRDPDKPFCFWFGGHEPHRPYEQGSGLRRGKRLSSVKLPPFLPDADIIRSDMLDYAVEIEWFDRQAGLALETLKKQGLLNNTLVIFTSDNGMPVPRAKAFSFDAGTHVPLAVMWKGHIRNPGRSNNDLISGVDFFPTILEAAGLAGIVPHTEGKSLFNIFDNGDTGITDRSRAYVFWGRERHSDARWDNLGYPERAVRSHRYLFIWNLKPERYPAGSPKQITGDSLVWAYDDIDPSPSKTYMIAHPGSPKMDNKGELNGADRKETGEKGEERNEAFDYYHQTFGRFPEEMLYDIKNDPYCLHNLAYDADYSQVKHNLFSVLRQKLKETHDPRMGDHPDIWESYRRYGPMRRFPRPRWADSILKAQVVRH